MRKDKSIRPFISETAIQMRIKELGKAIRRDHGNAPITCICVLKGAFFFAADLMRAIGGEVDVEFIHTARTENDTSGSFGKVVVHFDADIKNKVCLLVEDIVDTGHTLQALCEYINDLNPKKISTVTLLDKPNNREININADYIGFSIPDEFVVGYGLDLLDRYRALGYIAAYTP